MNGPLETLHLKEGVICPIPWRKRGIFGKLKPIVYAIVGMIILLSLIFHDNILSELSGYSQFTIVVLFVRVLFEQVDEWVPSDLDMVFYEDRIELFRKRVYRGRRFYRQEWQCMYYQNMTGIARRMNAKKLEIYGRARGVYHEYDKRTGELQERVAWDKTVDAGFVLYNEFMDVDMVVHTLEKYTSLKVEERMT